MPAISYYDKGNTALKFVHCGNITCSSGNTTTTLDGSGAPDMGLFSSWAVGRDGNPFIAYYDNGANNDLRTIHCTNVSCTSADTSVLAYSTNDAGNTPSVVIGTNGRPVISSQTATVTRGVFITACGDATCGTTGTPNATTTAADTSCTANAQCGEYTSIAIGSDGLPVFSYYQGVTDRAKIGRCTTVACTAFTTQSPFTTSIGEYNTINIGADGMPIITSYQTTGGLDPEFGHCTAIDCSTLTATGADSPETSNDIGKWGSSALGNDGLIIWAYYDNTAGGIRVARCQSTTRCTNSSANNSNTFGGGLTLGSAGVGLQSAYINNIFTSDAINPLNLNVNNVTRLSMNPNGISTFTNSSAVFKTLAGGDNTTAFQVQTSAGANVLAVDTTGSAVVVGSGDGGTPGATATIRGAAATGSNIAGGNINLDASNGTGSAGSGAIVLRTAASNSSTTTFDGNSGSLSTSSPLTFSHTVTAASNTLLVVGVTTTGAQATAATYNAVSMTQLAGTVNTKIPNATSTWYTLFYLVTSATTGAHNIVVTAAGATGISAGATSFANVNTASPLGTAVVTSASNQNSLTTGAISSSTKDLVFDSLFEDQSTPQTTPSPGLDQTQRWNQNDITGGEINAGSTKPGATSTTTTWTGLGTQWDATIVAMSIHGLAGTATSADSLTERLRVDQNGNVGINNAAPTATLDVLAPSTATIGLQVSNGSSTGAIARFLDGGSTNNPVFQLADGGAATFQNQSNSVNAFQLQNASGSQLINVDTTTTNLVTNPSVEQAIAGNWTTKGSNSTVAQTNTQQYVGNNSLAVTTAGSANAGASQSLTLTASTTYTLSMYVKAANSSFSTLNLGRQDVSGSDIDCLTAQTATTTGWTKLSCSFTTGTTITNSNLYLKDTGTNHNFYIDGVQLTAFSVLTNASIEQAIAGNWAVYGAPTLTKDSGFFFDGANSLKVVEGGSNQGAQQAKTLSTNTTYYLTFEAVGTTGAPFSTLNVGYSSTTASTGEVNCLTGQTVNIIWTQYSCSFTTPSTSSGAPYIYFKDTGTSASRTWYIDAVQLTVGPPVNSYPQGAPIGASAFFTNQSVGYQEGKIALNGIISSPVTFQAQSNSSTAFQILNSAGASLVNANTVNNLVSIGGQLPASPIGSLTTGAGSHGVYVLGNYAYIANDGANTLQIVDVSNPASPVSVRRCFNRYRLLTD